MKKFSAKTVISIMSFTLFALCLASAYLDKKQDIDESITRFKTTLTPAQKSETPVENAEGDTADGQQ